MKSVCSAAAPRGGGDAKRQPCSCHPELREGSLCRYRHYFHRDPSTSLRSAQDDVRRFLSNNQIARGKMTLLLNAFSIIKSRSQKSHFLQAPSRRSSRLRSRIAPRGNARVRTPLLLFPKISLRCDFREPCCRIPAAQSGKSECGALIMESIWRAPQREKRRLACKAGVPAGCLSNHGKKFYLF